MNRHLGTVILCQCLLVFGLISSAFAEAKGFPSVCDDMQDIACLLMVDHGMENMDGTIPCDGTCDAVDCCAATTLALTTAVQLSVAPAKNYYLATSQSVHTAFHFRLERPPRL